MSPDTHTHTTHRDPGAVETLDFLSPALTLIFFSRVSERTDVLEVFERKGEQRETHKETTHGDNRQKPQEVPHHGSHQPWGRWK